MTRFKHILALLVALVALVALAPAASAVTNPQPYRWVEPNPLRHSVDPNPRASSVDPNGVRYGSLERERRHARGIGQKAMKVKVFRLQGIRYNR